jgi:AhpD family alkylhydroperoxidase
MNQQSREKSIDYMYSKENLAKLKKMDSLAPEVMKAFFAFDKAAVAAGAIPVKYKELIAVAVALTTQCPYCIDIHNNNARKAGCHRCGDRRGRHGRRRPAGWRGGHTRDARPAWLGQPGC